MNSWVIRALRTVIALAMIGSVAVQAGLIALSRWDTDEPITGTRLALTLIAVLGVGTLQVVAVCIWRLLTMVRRGTVFSTDAFRYVDIVIGSISAASLLTFAVAVVGRFANHAAPGDAVAPGLIGLICGGALVVAGVALVVYVMRMLLAQAVELDSRTRDLEAELDEVI